MERFPTDRSENWKAQIMQKKSNNRRVTDVFTETPRQVRTQTKKQNNYPHYEKLVLELILCEGGQCQNKLNLNKFELHFFQLKSPAMHPFRPAPLVPPPFLCILEIVS